MDKVPKLRLFGGFRLEAADARPIRIPSRKGQALLAYLACLPNAPATREKLAALLWSESDSRRARQNLRQVLFTLHRVLAEGNVAILDLQDEQVGLLRGGVWIDVAEFESQLAVGSLAAMHQASALYSGDFLADLAIDTPVFGDWLVAARGRFHDRAIKCLSDLLDGQRNAGDLDSAIAAGIRALEIDTCREDIHRRLMELYLAKRMRTSALLQYRDCRDNLRRELCVPPDEETNALYRRILEQDATEDPGVESRFEVSLEAEAAHRDGRSAAQLEVELVGRSRELAALREEFAEVARIGCRLIALMGEAGVGKSRLLEAFARELARRGTSVYWTRARRAERPLPLAPWSELLDGLAAGRRALPRRPEGRLHEEQAPFCPSGEERADWRMARRDNWRRSFGSVTAALQDRAGADPLVVILEDLQWSDGDSLRLLGYAVRRLRHAPVLFVSTVRTDEPSGRARIGPVLRDLEGMNLVRHLDLRPLSREETMNLIGRARERLGFAPLRKAGLAEIWAMSEGNPGIVLGSLRTETDLAERVRVTLPNEFRDNILHSVSRLSRSAQALAGVASVICGRSVFAVLAEAAGLNREDALAALDELVEAGLVRTEGEHVVFIRLRSCRTIYQDLPGPRRRALHEAAARAIAQTHANELELYHGALARHRGAAGQGFEALEYELLAARVDLKGGARRAARDALRRVLKAVRGLGEDERTMPIARRARLLLAGICETEQDFGGALAILHALERQFERVDDAPGRIELLYALSRIHCAGKRIHEGREYARRALRIAEQRGGDGVWLAAERLMLRLHVLDGRRAETVERLTGLRQRAQRLKLHEDEAQAATALAVLHAQRGRFDEANRALDDALKAAKIVGDNRLIAGALQMSGMARSWAEDSGGALAALDCARSLAAQGGDLLRAYAVQGHRGFALCVAQRFDEAVMELDDAVEAARQLGAATYVPIFLAWLADATFRLGRHEAALAHAREAWRLANRGNQPWAHSVALRTLARVIATPHGPDPRGAERAARCAVAEQQSLGLDVEWVRSRMVQAQVLRAAGDSSGSQAVFRDAARLFQQIGLTRAAARAERLAAGP